MDVGLPFFLKCLKSDPVRRLKITIVNHQKQKSRANRLCPLPPSLRQEAYFPNLLTPASPNRQSFRVITRHVCCKLFLGST